MNELVRVSTTSVRLEEAMQEAEMKQTDLVNATGLNKSIVSRCVSGKTEPGNKTIMLLAQALNVSEMWLWGYDVPKERVSPQKEKPAGDSEFSQKKRDFIEKVKQMSDEELDRLDQILQIVERTK